MTTNGSGSCAWAGSSRRTSRCSPVLRRSPGAPEPARYRARPQAAAGARARPAPAALRWLLLAALALASLGGCGADLEPDQVAVRFWSAVITDDEAGARAQVRAEERDAVAIARDLLPVTAFEVGRYTVDGARATVATRLHLDENGRALVLPIDTVLVREGGGWRVDYAASTALARRDGELGQMLSGIRRFSELLTRGIERSTEELERSLPRLERELSGLEAEIKRQLPELRRRLERFERELRRALEPPPAPPPERIEI